MKTVTAIRHVQFEDLGSFSAVLNNRGFSITYVEAGREPLLDHVRKNPPDLLVVLGGPIGVYETDSYPFLKEEITLIKERIEEGRPILGICLGAQLIAAALGAKVYPSGTKEIGWSTIDLSDEGARHPLAAIGNNGTNVLHWHGDTFDLPPGAVHLASTPVCKNQAFAIGRSVLGLQFHAEVRDQDIESWLIGHACEIANAHIDVGMLRQDARRYANQLVTQAGLFFQHWLDGALSREQDEKILSNSCSVAVDVGCQ